MSKALAMIDKCANPGCSAPFRYLRDGKLFHIDRESPETAGRAEPTKPSHNREHFWLCGRCCQTVTLIYDRKRGVVPVPASVLRRAS